MLFSLLLPLSCWHCLIRPAAPFHIGAFVLDLILSKSLACVHQVCLAAWSFQSILYSENAAELVRKLRGFKVDTALSALLGTVMYI